MFEVKAVECWLVEPSEEEEEQREKCGTAMDRSEPGIHPTRCEAIRLQGWAQQGALPAMKLPVPLTSRGDQERTALSLLYEA